MTAVETSAPRTASATTVTIAVTSRVVRFEERSMVIPFYICRISTYVEGTPDDPTHASRGGSVPPHNGRRGVMAASPRRGQLLDAALHVIADEGLRGLTH